MDHFQVHFQSQSMMAPKCISELARSQPPILHHHHLQVPLQIHSIMPSTFAQLWLPIWIPQHVWSWPPGCHDGSLQVYLKPRPITTSKLLWSWPPLCISKLFGSQTLILSCSTHKIVLDVTLWVHLIDGRKYISNLVRSHPPTSYQSVLNDGVVKWWRSKQ